MKHKVTVPRKISIGPHQYSIFFSDTLIAEEDLQGRIIPRRLQLLLDGYRHPSSISETFIHEVLHGINVQYCNTHISEDLIGCLANGILQVLYGLGIEFDFSKVPTKKEVWD